jgi:hypothetical protein
MRALFDLMHPAQVRFFRPVISDLLREGSQVLVTSRAKDETAELLDAFGIAHVCLSRPATGPLGMAGELVARTARMLRLARRFRPDVMAAKMGVSIGPVGRALGVPTVMFEDTEFAWLQIALSAPLATAVCTGLGYGRRFPGKQLRYNAPPHLAYTHPCRFAPDPALLRRHGLEPDEPYAVLRVKAWGAMHDLGASGPGDDETARLVEAVARRARPLISAERPLPELLARWGSPVPVADVLHLLAFARLYVGEGSSMAAEAACLGTPAVYISPVSRRGYLDAMEQRYGHVTTVKDIGAAAQVAEAWLASDAMKERARQARERLVAECDDPARFALDVLHRYALRRHA